MSEKIKDIIREMRKKADQADFACCGNVDATFVRIFADRIARAFAMHAKVVEQHETNYTTQKEVTK